MKTSVPRLALAGTNSGCGKTTVTCAVLQALTDRGLRVGAFKCGPDYIDPMFHSRIIGAGTSNLDPFFFDGSTLNSLLAENGAEEVLLGHLSRENNRPGLALAAVREQVGSSLRVNVAPPDTPSPKISVE